MHTTASLSGLRVKTLSPIALCVSVALCSGCVAPATMMLSPALHEHERETLASLVESFYRAPDKESMREAVAKAREIDEHSALYHEIAAHLALLENEALAFDHLTRALLDPASDAADYHIEVLHSRLNLTLEDQRRLSEVLEVVRLEHPSPAVRARASWYQVRRAQILGDQALRQGALEALRPLPLAVIGTWDNDRGKGFDIDYPPEREIDFDASYPGYRVEATWRKHPPVNPYGYLSLSQLMTPYRWKVAYATGAFKVESAGSYDIRVATSAPIKVWVNDQLVFEGRRLGGSALFDGVRIPVELEAGVSRVLVKSAQETGLWRLFVRLTRPDGSPPGEHEIAYLSPDTPPSSSGVRLRAELSEIDLISSTHMDTREGSARRLIMETFWASWLGLSGARVERAELARTEFPDAFLGLDALVRATWDNQERDRAADLLGQLVTSWETAFPASLLLQANFWRQQNLRDQALELLLWLREHYPELPGVWWNLATFMDSDGWDEEACQAVKRKLELRPGSVKAIRRWAKCEGTFHPGRSQVVYERLLAERPTDSDALRYLSIRARARGDLRAARRFAVRRVEAWPSNANALLDLADVLRAEGKYEQAADTLTIASALDPLWSTPYLRLGRLAVERGDTESGALYFREALARNPRAKKLPERIALHAPGEKERWIEDVPDADAIEGILAQARETEAEAGANVLNLLQDTVTFLAKDKAATSVVTFVARAENDSGRDRLTHLRLRSGRQHRVIMAYALDAEGRRIEASSIRGTSVRFRDLSVGSIVVLQYRVEHQTPLFLRGHYFSLHIFQAAAEQNQEVRWVLWAPSETIVNEEAHPEVKREEQTEGDYRRIEFTARDVSPLISEPAAPPLREHALFVAVSTVPDWETFASWERSLLRDVFRSNPEIQAFTRGLVANAESTEEKLLRIYDFVIREIRYQQDYEHAIAGVKPKPAPVTFNRRYGDCKDKAVLMITMADLVGIEAKFAMVRTRDKGRILLDVPSQQFNHAIVYIPEQEGLDDARFLDPTVQDLDLALLRPDNPGAMAMVFGAGDSAFEWIEVPFQAPELSFGRFEVELRLQNDTGRGIEPQGTFRVSSQGPGASAIRRGARNPEVMRRIAEALLSQAVPGAQLSDFEPPGELDLRRPVSFEVSFAGEDVVRVDGNRLRIPLPMRILAPDRTFALDERRFPLLMGAPNSAVITSSIVLPGGTRVERLPEGARIETECIVFERDVESREGIIAIEQRLTFRCERIMPEDYRSHRSAIQRVNRLLSDEVVLERR